MLTTLLIAGVVSATFIFAIYRSRQLDKKLAKIVKDSAPTPKPVMPVDLTPSPNYAGDYTRYTYPKDSLHKCYPRVVVPESSETVFVEPATTPTPSFNDDNDYDTTSTFSGGMGGSTGGGGAGDSYSSSDTTSDSSSNSDSSTPDFSDVTSGSSSSDL